jgi:hypothetical protein
MWTDIILRYMKKVSAVYRGVQKYIMEKKKLIVNSSIKEKLLKNSKHSQYRIKQLWDA